MKYLVTFGGGLGENVWDNWTVIEAESVREALDYAEPAILEAGGVVFSVEQED